MLTYEKPVCVFKKDCNGNWYSIPENKVDHFIQLVETIENSEFMSDEWFDANAELNEEFGSFVRVDL